MLECKKETEEVPCNSKACIPDVTRECKTSMINICSPPVKNCTMLRENVCSEDCISPQYKDCSLVTKTECSTFSERLCSPSQFRRCSRDVSGCESLKNKEHCSERDGLVCWTEVKDKCRAVPRNRCEAVPREHCNVRKECKECKEVEREVCTEGEQLCREEPKEDCVERARCKKIEAPCTRQKDVCRHQPKQACQPVEREVCQVEPRQVCQLVPDRVCEQKCEEFHECKVCL